MTYETCAVKICLILLSEINILISIHVDVLGSMCGFSISSVVVSTVNYYKNSPFHFLLTMT